MVACMYTSPTEYKQTNKQTGSINVVSCDWTWQSNMTVANPSMDPSILPAVAASALEYVGTSVNFTIKFQHHVIFKQL